MSLGMAIKAPEGMVLAAESRVTLGTQGPNGQTIPIPFDNATKIFGFSKPHNFCGVVTYGQAALGLRTAHSFLPELEEELSKKNRMSVANFADYLNKFYQLQWETVMPKAYKGPQMTFLVVGFNEKEPYGRIYEFKLPGGLKIIEHHSKPGEFGITWGGQREIVDRLVQGYPSALPSALISELKLNKDQQKTMYEILRQFSMRIPLQALPLQDCIDLAIFFIRSTISAQHLSMELRGCGGHIDVAIITRGKGFEDVQKKKIHGELNPFTGLGGQR